jgi:hypothetical protein
VEAGAFEDDSDRAKHPRDFPLALGALLHWFVSHLLEGLEPVLADLAFINVSRHYLTSL